MGDVSNLRMFRKQVERQQSEKQAAANRLLHGRSRRDKEQEKLRRDISQRSLDQHRIETGNTDEISGRETLGCDRRPQNKRES
ncbi:MAG: DUF4169 family protein [Pseudorhodoplanes sp.]